MYHSSEQAAPPALQVCPVLLSKGWAETLSVSPTPATLIARGMRDVASPPVQPFLGGSKAVFLQSPCCAMELGD